MNSIRSFRDLEVWQKAMDLVVECYELTRQFPTAERYGLTGQLQRAAVSVPANIAEGHTRQHTGEFLQFLSIAAGSLAELETHLLIAVRLGYLGEEQADRAIASTRETGRMLNGLRRALKTRDQDSEVRDQ